MVRAMKTGHDLVQAAPTGFGTGVVTQHSRGGRALSAGPAPGADGDGVAAGGLAAYDHWGDLPVLILSAVALVGRWVRQLHRGGRPVVTS